jgi:hypothetical protein
MPLVAVATTAPTEHRGTLGAAEAAMAAAGPSKPGARPFAPLPLEYGRRPALLPSCPYCQSLNVRSRLQTFPSWKTWAAVLLIALVFWPLAWIPLVLDCAKSTEHYCPSCHALVGSVDAFDDACVKRRS